MSERRAAHVARDGVALAYEIGGAPRSDGRGLVLIHGLGDSRRLWDSTVERLSLPVPIVAVDLRGHGDSEIPVGPESYTMEHFVGDVEAVLDATQISSALLVGFSLGGAVALHFALARATRVAGVAVINANAAARDPLEERALAETAASGSAGAVLPSEGERRWASKLLERLGPGPRLAAAAGRTASIVARAGEIEVPVWLIASDRDPGFAARSAALLPRLRRGRRLLIADAGHAVMRDQPDALAAAITEFVASIDAGG